MKATTAVLVLALTALPLVAENQAHPGDSARNIRFALTLVDTTGSGKVIERKVQALAVEGRTARMHSGWKVAIPVTRSGQRLDSPVTGYHYQDVGMQVSLEGRTVGEERVRVAGRLEVSAIDPELALPSPHTPQLGTFSHDFEANLASGLPTTIIEAPKPEGGSMALILTVEVSD